MWFSLSEQTAYFLWSIVLGAAAGMLYDLVRALRELLHAGRLHLLLSDILFFGVMGVLTSLFALPFNKGSVRAFIVFGEAVGFLVWHFTAGHVTGRFYSIMSKGITLLLRKICDLLKKFFDFLLKTASRVVYNVSVVIDRLFHTVSAVHQKHRKKKQQCRSVRKNRPRKRRRTSRGAADPTMKRNGYERKYKKKKESRSRRRDRRSG